MTLRRRLPFALAGYIALGLAAAFTLEHETRWIILILLAALALKSYVAVLRSEQD